MEFSAASVASSAGPKSFRPRRSKICRAFGQPALFYNRLVSSRIFHTQHLLKKKIRNPNNDNQSPGDVSITESSIANVAAWRAWGVSPLILRIRGLTPPARQ